MDASFCYKGLSINDVRSQGEGFGILRAKGVLQLMRTSALFVAINFGFFQIFAVSARTVKPVRTKGEEAKFFAILLWKAPNIIFWC